MVVNDLKKLVENIKKYKKWKNKITSQLKAV